MGVRKVLTLSLSAGSLFRKGNKIGIVSVVRHLFHRIFRHENPVQQDSLDSVAHLAAPSRTPCCIVLESFPETCRKSFPVQESRRAES